MVNAIGSGGGGQVTTSVQQMRSQAAERMLKAVDTNQDGKITENELSKAIAAGGSKKGPSASEIMKQLDQGNKGYITEKDLEAGLAKIDMGTKAQGPAPGGAGGGEAPAGGEGAMAAGGASGASASTSYDPADLNQDGVVTLQEGIQYAMTHYVAPKESQSGNQISLYG